MACSRTLPLLAPRGRGAASNPPNRFQELHLDELPPEECLAEGESNHRSETRFFLDHSRSAIRRNDSPDLPFAYTINPYRGCEHGCVYCYARPGHEYLGLSAGLDFETRIFVKQALPSLLRRELSSPRWRPGTVAISGVTDAYQPIERRLELTRRCVQLLSEFGNPVSIITKNQLVTRDLDLLRGLADRSAVAVTLSITTLDPELQRKLEPRASAPRLRLEAITELARAGIPAGVMVAPLIPGLTDHELPAILEAAAKAGARYAGFVPVRLPGAVSVLFEEWLARHLPDRREKVLHRIREVRGGEVDEARFGHRMRGEGEYAEQLAALFRIICARLGLDRSVPILSTAGWIGSTPETRSPSEQLALF